MCRDELNLFTLTYEYAKGVHEQSAEEDVNLRERNLKKSEQNSIRMTLMTHIPQHLLLRLIKLRKI
jgi:hypothetical protein